MSIDAILKDLTDAIKAQTEALNRQADTMDKLMTVDMSAAAVATEKEKPAPKKKRAAKAKPVVELVEPIVEPDEPAVVEPEPATLMTKEVAQERLRGIASQLTDTAPLFELIKKHGGAQFSDLDPSCYEALLSDAEAELATQKAIS